MINSVRIIGMGALGILFGHILSKELGKDNVAFIVDENRKSRYEKETIRWNEEVCDFRFTLEEEEQPVDLIIFAVKATALESAIRTARNAVGDNTVIISLLNGVSSEELIGAAYGMDKVIYSVAQGMDAVRLENSLTFSKLGEICIGIMEDEREEKERRLHDIIELFDQVHIPYTIESNIKHRLWSKFMLNVGVNQIVTIYEGTYQTIHQEGIAREQMKEAMREVIQLSKYEGITLTEKDLDGYVALVDTLSPSGMPSMRQDGYSKRKSEVELFAGTVLRLAKKYELSTPVNDEIYNKIIEMEKDY